MIKEKWEKFGEENPYYAVLTIDKYNKEKFSEDARGEFFETGFNYVNRIFNEINLHFTDDFRPRKAIDFGCGVGRLAIPLAKKSGSVVGIDISEQMLEKARENSSEYDLHNTEFFQTDEFFKTNASTFDFIHSNIVFQHINPKTGLRIFENLVKVLNADGIGVIQFAYKNPGSNFASLRFKIYRDFPFLFKIRNALKKLEQPLFPMYEYDLNEVFYILQKNDCHKTSIKFSDHGMNGVVIFFQKQKESAY